MADITIKKKKNRRVLHLSGELVVQDAERLASGLLEALGDADRVEIDLSSVTDLDISCLQLFCAAHKTSAQQNKLLRIDGVCPEAVRRLAENAGFGHAGCSLDVGDACLWKEESRG
jgi:ABC-type transporter Mla MlaB component